MKNDKIYSKNKKVNFEYEVLETYEAGIQLTGGEIKGIRANRASIRESHIKIIKNEMFIFGMHISLPDYSINRFTKNEPDRDRKLLMHKKEISKMFQLVTEKGLTLVPRKIYQPETSNKVKVEVCLVRGKKLHDKRETLKRKQMDMDSKRQMKDY